MMTGTGKKRFMLGFYNLVVLNRKQNGLPNRLLKRYSCPRG
jgi:hypothetical protein